MSPLVRPAAVLLALFTLLLGVAYPIALTQLAHATMPAAAAGNPALIGQQFVAPRYFWSRPSATTTPYDAAASTGSNLGVNSARLAKLVRARVDALRAADPEAPARIPVDLVTASGSGLDPHLSPAGVFFQVGRVARARHLDVAKVRALAEAHVVPRTFGLFGEPRVDVVALNRALDALGQ